MGNPLLTFWYRRPAGGTRATGRPRVDLIRDDVNESDAVFLVLRRIRLPMIVLIVIFSVSVLGLSIVPGQAADGSPARMSVFDAFYFMSYTATTIGYGELPNAFSDAQRMWVTFSIYLTVIGWAYAIGSLVSLGRDQVFRRALAVRGFRRKVRSLPEPFVLIAGYGHAGRTTGTALDSLGRRFVVLDRNAERISALEIDPYVSDVPGLVADARAPDVLALAGLSRPACHAVLALSDEDETNLAVVQAARLLRPDVMVIARANTRGAARRMADFAPDAVIDPNDRFGDYLGLSLRQPATFQLVTWLMQPPGGKLPPRPEPRSAGSWVVYAAGPFADEMTHDLRTIGLDVVVVPPDEAAAALAGRAGPETAGESLGGAGAPGAVEPAAAAAVVHAAATAAGMVAGAGNDTVNLSLVAATRAVNPGVFVAMRRNRHQNDPLLRALDVDSVLVPSELVAHEVLARLVTPVLWSFLELVPNLSDAWAAELVDRLAGRCGHRISEVWAVIIGTEQTPAVSSWLEAGRELRVGDLLRSTQDRTHSTDVVALLLARGERQAPAPDDGLSLEMGDVLLFAGRARGRRSVAAAAFDPTTLAYLATGERIPTGWVARRLARRG